MIDRLAKSLVVLREQVNEKFPSRRRDSDGWIGDASHQSRVSDHNPWIKDGEDYVVSALDITHDPQHGFDSYAFADMLLRNEDPRIKYVISNRRIAAGAGGIAPWVWRSYTGANPHDHHVHISVKSDKEHYDNPAEWGIGGVVPPEIQQAAAAYVSLPPRIRIGSTGAVVTWLQKFLGCKETGTYVARGELEWALRLYQARHGLDPDGDCGPQTWKVIAPSGKLT